MIAFLPRNLASLADICAMDNARFAIDHIRLQASPRRPGLYRAEATDGKVLVIVQGPLISSVDALAAKLEMQWDSLENVGAPEALIHFSAWKEGFRLCKRNPAVALLAIGDPVNAMKFACGTESLERELPNGLRFPDIQGVIRDTTKGRPQPLAPGVHFNPALLVPLLKLAADLKIGRLEFLTFAPHGTGANARKRPIALRGGNDAGQLLDALVMPLA